MFIRVYLFVLYSRVQSHTLNSPRVFDSGRKIIARNKCELYTESRPDQRFSDCGSLPKPWVAVIYFFFGGTRYIFKHNVFNRLVCRSTENGEKNVVRRYHRTPRVGRQRTIEKFPKRVVR